MNASQIMMILYHLCEQHPYNKCCAFLFSYQSVITGIEESPVDSDDDHNEEDEDGDLGATVRGKKRLRQQITSDSDEPGIDCFCFLADLRATDINNLIEFHYCFAI